ncbi:MULTISPECIES: hypothetical protein [Burkholderia]|uniref:Uncharacterized protein n=1 Tax=Burkholderia savannae TaxID=1637837 RepID=A0ABR5TE94_9BURK|nr:MULTISPECIES: hypothetical protein [Burkholderia]KGR97584.1 hypothetical protein X946_1240 [Burkholderia sp. ABCPW 111]KWZ43278.1 hypothetical protein WS72_10685 [Burkholderia savannae]KWZ46301.1 hypothetical protein WS73_19805 [Burkholderia savannae]
MNTPLLMGFGALALFGAIGIAASRELLRAIDAQKRCAPVPVRVRSHRPHRDGRRTVL